MTWNLDYTKTAQDDLEKLDPPVRKKVIAKIEWFVENFDNITPLPLHGPYAGFFKLVAGDWRIVYDFDNSKKLITIYRIDHRGRIYKRK